MDARERWQALQAQLTLARTRFEHGDRAAALDAVDAALAIDPNFLAAHSLRDLITSGGPAIAPPPVSRTSSPSSAAASAPRSAPPSAPRSESSAAPASVSSARPLVSAEGYAQFEQRARRRRVDRRLDAARAAISAGRLKEAASALDEVIELDPNLPELRDLTAQFDEMRRTTRRPHSGRWLAAAAAFGAVVLGATWLQESAGLWSRSMVAIAPLVAPAAPVSVDAMAAEPEAVPLASETVPTNGEMAGALEGARTPIATDAAARSTDPAGIDAPVPETHDADARAVDPRATDSGSTDAHPADARIVEGRAADVPPPIVPPIPNAPSANASSNAPAAPVAMTAPPPPPATPAVVPVSSVVPTVNDEALVKQVLQRYRTAYEGLDARSARAVWPAVNETALARAFDGLESQTLTFEACDVRLRGEGAEATCRGSARYVPKVGSHEPRVEPRTWNFVLKKNGADWTIESARAGR